MVSTTFYLVIGLAVTPLSSALGDCGKNVVLYPKADAPFRHQLFRFFVDTIAHDTPLSAWQSNPPSLDHNSQILRHAENYEFVFDHFCESVEPTAIPIEIILVGISLEFATTVGNGYRPGKSIVRRLCPLLFHLPRQSKHIKRWTYIRNEVSSLESRLGIDDCGW